MRTLIAGGSGLLGRVLLNRFKKRGECVGVSRKGLENTLVFDLSSESETDRLFSTYDFELVIHAGGFTNVDGCERDPEQAFRCNALSAKYLAKKCGEKKIPFIYVSTDYVFDGKKKSPYSESDKENPVNVYGMTKLAGERYTKALGFFSSVVRTSWLFGACSENNFVNAIANRLKRENVVAVLDDQKDSPTYVEDLADCLENVSDRLTAQAASDPAKKYFELFQFCNQGATTRLEMARKIRDFLKLDKKEVKKLQVQEIKNRLAIRPRFASLSTRHYKKVFKAKIRTWQNSLEEYVTQKLAGTQA